LAKESKPGKERKNQRKQRNDKEKRRRNTLNCLNTRANMELKETDLEGVKPSETVFKVC
jgi:hypothetical protein